MAQLSEDEILKISQECLKDKDFISKFKDAVGDQDIPDADKDPAAHARFLQEIQGKLATQAIKEKEGQVFEDEEGTWGYTVPIGVFCIKAANESGEKKVFINICKSEAIQEPMPMTESEVTDSGMENKDLQFRVPISIGPCRIDKDKAGKPSAVYDIAVNPLTLEKCSADPEFKRLVCAMCLYGLKQKHEPDLNTDQYKQPNLVCKGQPVMQRVRLTRTDGKKNAFNNEIKTGTSADVSPDIPVQHKKPSIEVLGEETPAKQPKPGSGTEAFYASTKIDEETEGTTTQNENAEATRNVTRTEDGSYDWASHKNPELNSYWRARTAVPEKLTLKIHLPEVQSSIAEVYVDVQPSAVSIFSCDDEDLENPYLREELRFPIDIDSTSAKFAKKKKILTLVLQVMLPDEMQQKEKTRRETAEEELKEQTEIEEKQAREEADRKAAERKYERQRKEDEHQQSFNKQLAETAKAIQAGALPPDLQKMITELPPSEATTLLGRLIDGTKRGDSVDPLLDKLPSEAITSMIVAIREKLGLAAPEPPKKEPVKKEVPKEAEEGEEDDEAHSFGFHKMGKKLFGVDIQNRFLFALDL
eukprot:TRINITY_DN1454_c0_g3_i1.p1 TRINITY_DN1454_c0_g3~~TRINITY_DN1454_c0_g3_i1.p1  ORF type:complete len:603 (+),score=140.87 TRINITY_DN1454_c0_g3_i1:49-1809(+)